MKRKTKILLISLFATFTIYSFLHYDQVIQKTKSITSDAILDDIKTDSKNDGTIAVENSSILNTVPQEIAKSEVYFCPREKCLEKLIYLVNNHENISCAFFALDNDGLEDALKEKGARLVIDNENEHRLNKGIEAKIDTSSQYSHNKFCVFDNKIVTTGSFNPTDSENKGNDNNFAIYYSKILAENYLSEFEELYSGQYGKGSKVKNPSFILNGNLLENYFCPEDACADHTIALIKGAKKSIDFMYFSFTDDNIAAALIVKQKDGIKVRGVFEKQQESQYSEYSNLKNAGLDVFLDGNKYKMHHKVIIIDGNAVAFGSYNPTNNGNKENDENVIVDYDPVIVGRFSEEFKRVFDLANP